MTATVLDLVRRQAAAAPTGVAVAGAVAPISFQVLIERVEALARLLARRVGPGDVVALVTDDPAEGICGFLATHAVGGVALMPDTSAPEQAFRFVLQDANVAACLRFEQGVPSVELRASRRGAAAALPDGAAYILYTSGSTGRPKGVVVPHEALHDRMDGMTRLPGFPSGRRILAMTSLCFDIALVEMLLPLVAGGTMIVAPPKCRQDPGLFAAFTRDAEPDVMQATPSFWRLVLAAGWPGRLQADIWSGGEALTPSLAAELLPRCRELWNLYGPTEAAIYATGARIESPDDVSLGLPLPGTRVGILGEDGLMQDGPFAVGELVIAGAGLADGYLGLPELTAERFGAVAGFGDRAYRTGDLARRRANGSLEFLGRKDGQVKLRGHRIELQEVEAVLEEHPAVAEVVVTLHNATDPRSAHLTALVVADGPLSARDLRRWLSERVIAIKVPKYITFVSEFPRTSAGKIDRLAVARIPRRPAAPSPSVSAR